MLTAAAEWSLVDGEQVEQAGKGRGRGWSVIIWSSLLAITTVGDACQGRLGRCIWPRGG